MRKWLKYLFFGVGLVYTYAIARILTRTLADVDTRSGFDDHDMLID